jgi:hypothetical protein
MRKPRNSKYKIKAYYNYLDKQYVFYCKERVFKNISNEMGTSSPFANGNKVIETDSDIDFKIEHEIYINDVGYSIEQVNLTMVDNDLNAMRGKPRYIKELIIR